MNELNPARVKPVTATELSRRTADLLDEIALGEIDLLVVRYGRPAAMLVRYEDGPSRRIRRNESFDPRALPERVAVPEPEPDLKEFEHLKELPRRMLVDFAADPVGWNPEHYKNHISEILAALGALDIEGLLERGRVGPRFLTPLGKKVAALLASQQEAAGREGGSE